MFSAIFVENDTVRPRVWNATGLEGGTQIAANVRGAMIGRIIRQAAVAIVYKERLLHARGFNMAERDWPQAEPTTRFRLASCSKTITALAALRLIEGGKMSLDDRVQDILNLKTPDGHGPDPTFSEIRVRHLIEHSRGVQTNTFESLSQLTTGLDNTATGERRGYGFVCCDASAGKSSGTDFRVQQLRLLFAGTFDKQGARDKLTNRCVSETSLLSAADHAHSQGKGLDS
jgi:hypothetical protein